MYFVCYMDVYMNIIIIFYSTIYYRFILNFFVLLMSVRLLACKIFRYLIHMNLC